MLEVDLDVLAYVMARTPSGDVGGITVAVAAARTRSRWAARPSGPLLGDVVNVRSPRSA